MSQTKIKIESPNQLPESGVTRVQFKSWKEGMLVYLKQNDDFHCFLSDGIYKKWKAADDDPNRITALHATETPPVDDQAPNVVDARSKLLAKRQRDLNTMLSLIGRKVDQYDYDDVMNFSTDLESIWNMIELVYDIGRKGVHFLELNKIKFETGESPAKFYKKIYHHFMDNLYKTGTVLKYKQNSQLQEDEKLSPTLLNFMLYFTIESIDSRLMKKIKDKWGHLLDENTGLHDLKPVILKAIPDLLERIDSKDSEANSADTQLSAFGSSRGRFSDRGGFSDRGRFSNRGRFQSRPTASGRSFGGKFCRICQAARCPKRVYTTHNVSECSRLSRRDVEDLRVMMCDMKISPDEYPDSDTDPSQD